LADGFKVGWERRFEMHVLPPQMQSQARRVQERTLQSRKGGVAVAVVAHHGMADGGHVGTDLVHASRKDAHVQEGVSPEPAAQVPTGLGLLADPLLPDHHRFRSVVARVHAFQAFSDGSLGMSRVPQHQSQVFLRCRMGPDLALHRQKRASVLRDDHDAGGSPVEAVGEGRLEDARGDAQVLLHAFDQGGSGRGSGSRVDRHASRFVEHEKVVVLEKDTHLGTQSTLARCGWGSRMEFVGPDVQVDLPPGLEPHFAGGLASVDPDRSLAQETEDPGQGHVGEDSTQISVHALPGISIRDGKFRPLRVFGHDCIVADPYLR